MSAGVQQAGDVEFIKLELIDNKDNNRRYDLLGSFFDFTVYEDIFSPVLTGYVALVETQNFISLLPITGDEMVYAEFVTPSLNKSIKIMFHVVKIGEREHGDKKNAYTIELISYEGYVDLNRKYSAAFSGNTSELIKSVYESNFKQSLVEHDVADNFIKFVSPYWGPMKILNHITSRALYPNNKMITPNYLFYQTNRGHKFKSLTNLFNQQPFMEYYFDKNPSRDRNIDGTSTRNINREYATILKLNFEQSNDYVKNMLNGAYNHRVFGLNIFRKRFDVKTYSYSENFDKTSHLDKYRMTTLAASKLSGLHTIHHTCPQLFNNISDISDEIIAKRISLLAQLEMYKLDIVVHGRTDMEVGKVINFWMNNFRTVDQSDKYTDNTYDKYYSGKYLITAIQHRFTMSKHQMNMQIVKESLFNEIKVTQ